MAIDYEGGLTCAIGVTDLDRSINWYRDVLGFALIYRRDDIAWCELDTGIVNVSIGLSERETAGGQGGATLTFGVTNLDSAKVALDAAGVRQDGPERNISGLVRLLTFFDPDDNSLMFYEDLRGIG